MAAVLRAALLCMHLQEELLEVAMCVQLLQSCPSLCDSMDCSPSGSSVRGIIQARILEWVVISFSIEELYIKDLHDTHIMMG